MTRIQPERLLYRGVVQATGFYFEGTLVPRDVARRRILSLWTPGTVVYDLKQGILARLPAPMTARCEEAQGLPLVEYRGVLLATPLSARELETMAAPAGALVLARDGIAEAMDLFDAVEEDVASWLEIARWHVLSTVTLGASLAPPLLVAEAGDFDARARLDGVPGEAPERKAVLEALRKAMAQKANGDEAPVLDGRKVAGWLKAIIGNTARSSNGQQTDCAGSRFGDAVNRFAERLLATSGLAKVIGRKQAEYIRHMMDLFERGDLHEALRHAISMGELEDAVKPPSLTVPRPRGDLTLSASSQSASTSLCMHPEFYTHLKALYRQAFTRLEREGRIEEAAFVLAELLKANEEAVSFLERHGRFRLAAEIAEARKLPRGLVVRQWFLAGDAERAVRIARRSGAFADAMLRLERAGHARAAEFRMLWASSLAACGDYAGAIQALQPMMQVVLQAPDMRAQVEFWLGEAIALGGPVSARMLARKIGLFPDDQGTLRDQALVLLEDEEAETGPARLAFALVLSREEATPLAVAIARSAARSMMRDTANGLTPIDKGNWQQLIRFSGDAALRADMPPLPASGAPEPSRPLSIVLAAADSGAFPIHDAAFLPDGRCILGLGEAGLRLITRDGRTAAHLDQPAHKLVVSDHGNQAIALAPRGDAWRMARMNLVTRRTQFWCEAALQAFAPDYDGSIWFVAMEKTFLAIDPTADGFEALWRLPDLDGNIQSIARSSTQCAFLLFSAGAADPWGRITGPWSRLEQWTHSLPTLLLRDRKEVSCPPDTTAEGTDYVQRLMPDGTVLYVNIESAEGDLFGLWHLVHTGMATGPLILDTMPDRPYLLSLRVSSTWLIVSTRDAHGVECRVFERGDMRVRAKIALLGSTDVSVRIAEPLLTLADDRGRLLVLDLERRERVRDVSSR